MGKNARLPMNKLLRVITMGYVLVIIPAAIVYSGMYLLTDMRGKDLFDSFLPVAILLLLFYFYYLIRPGRLFGSSIRESSRMQNEDSASDRNNSAHSSPTSSQTGSHESDQI